MAVVVTYVMISYFVAYTAKTAGLAKKWVPVVSATAGLVCGIVGYIMGIEGDNILDAIAIGLFSGFSAVGTNEIIKYTFIRKE